MIYTIEQLRRYKKAKQIVKELNKILEIIKATNDWLSIPRYKKYSPVKEIINNLNYNKIIISSYKKSYEKIVLSKGKK